MTSPRGHAQFTLRFTYGCCEEGEASDAKGRREEIIHGHGNNPDFGFSTAVRLASDKPTRVSLSEKGLAIRSEVSFLTSPELQVPGRLG